MIHNYKELANLKTEQREALFQIKKELIKEVEIIQTNIVVLKSLMQFIESTQDNDRCGTITEDVGDMILGYLQDARDKLKKDGFRA